MQPDILKSLHDRAASDRLLTMAEVGDLLQVSVSTLFRMRQAGSGPAWIKVRGSIRYRQSAVREYLDTAEAISG